MSPRPYSFSGWSEVITASMPGVGELLAPGAGGLEVVEVADDLPVVVGGVADVELGEAVGVERSPADAEELAELVADAHRPEPTRWPRCR